MSYGTARHTERKENTIHFLILCYTSVGGQCSATSLIPAGPLSSKNKNVLSLYIVKHFVSKRPPKCIL